VLKISEFARIKRRQPSRPRSAVDQKHLYVLDESSLASTKQMYAFLQRLGPDDRVVLVGDIRRHEATCWRGIIRSRG